jgi:hypothetical protein
MDKDGYVIIKNILTPEQLERGLNCDKNGKMNYKTMKKFIDDDFLSTIVKNTKILIDPIYVKFRYSNNNNSKDASTFHSDIYNYTDMNTIPIYTCLCYFDKTQMELIPGSHTKDFHSKNTSIESYLDKKTIDIDPGDILIFHANLYHRGIKYNQGNRRLLQVFEVFPDKKTYETYSSQLLTVITSKNSSMNFISEFSYYVSKVPVLIDTINFFHYILVYNDLQYKIILKDIEPWNKKDRFVTYEPNKRLEYKDAKTEETINVNVICQMIQTIEPSNYYLYLFIFIVLLFIILYYFTKHTFKGNKKSKIRSKTRSKLS